MANKNPTDQVLYADLKSEVARAVRLSLGQVVSSSIAGLTSDGIFVGLAGQEGLAEGDVVAMTGTGAVEGATYPNFTKASDATQAGSWAPMGVLIAGVDGDTTPASGARVHVRMFGLVTGKAGSALVGDPVFCSGAGAVSLTPGVFSAGNARCIGRVVRAGGSDYDFWVNGFRSDESEYWFGAKHAALRYHPSDTIECSGGFVARSGAIGIRLIGASGNNSMALTSVNTYTALTAMDYAPNSELRLLRLTTDSLSITFEPAAVERWRMEPGSPFTLRPAGQNTQDIGDATHRVRDVHVGTSVKIGASTVLTDPDGSSGFLQANGGFFSNNSALGFRSSDGAIKLTVAGGVFFVDGPTGGVNMRANEVTKFQINSTGIGFFAATPVAKPTVTGAKGSNAALGSLMTALSNLGLVTDSTSA